MCEHIMYQDPSYLRTSTGGYPKTRMREITKNPGHRHRILLNVFKLMKWKRSIGKTIE